jgi:hypothetical protein
MIKIDTKWKRYLFSSLITFMVGFLTTLSALLGSANSESIDKQLLFSALLGGVTVGFRGVLKYSAEFFVEYQKQSR